MTFAPDTQQGATFAITGLAAFEDAATSIPRTSTPIPVIDATHLGTTGMRTKIAGDLKDPQQFTVTFQHDGSGTMPTIGTVYTITITAPLASGDGTAENWAGTAICTDVRGPDFSSDTEALQTTEIDWQPDGGFGSGSAWAHTAAS